MRTSQQERNSFERRLVYVRVKTQHFAAISSILHRSSFHEDIALLERALFHRNIYSVLVCEATIFTSSSGTTKMVTVHREMLTLVPSKQLLLSCKAASETHVSLLHNTIGTKAGADNLVLKHRIFHISSLKNSTIVNTDLRIIQENEKHLGVFLFIITVCNA